WKPRLRPRNRPWLYVCEAVASRVLRRLDWIASQSHRRPPPQAAFVSELPSCWLQLRDMDLVPCHSAPRRDENAGNVRCQRSAAMKTVVLIFLLGLCTQLHARIELVIGKEQGVRA